MKKKYTSPSINVIEMDAPQICEGSKHTWHVDHKEHSKDLQVGSDYGYIFDDPGAEYYVGRESEDPWNSDNW